MPANYDAVKKQFTDTFGPGGTIHVVRSPGRVNLIGEHTDYNDGFVFPMAIEPHVLIVYRARTDGKVRLSSTIFPRKIAEFSILERPTRGEPKWANYSKGMAAMLIDAGVKLVGMDALLSNTLPVGGGLSSSAALEVGTGRALLSLIPREMDSHKLALLAQEAEHKYALVPCGIMDQTIVAGGKAGTAMLLDCRLDVKQDYPKKYIPIDPDVLRVVIVNSMVKHELSGGEYAQRRHQCEEGVAYFQKANPRIKALRDVTMEQVIAAEKDLPEIIFKRCRHVIGENTRTTDAADLLIAKEYQVSTPELDYLVEQSMTIPGVYGARMTGGGFGGCIVALVKPDGVTALTTHLNTVYPKKVGKKPEIFVTTATDGAKVIE
jgi:galactokinase